MPRDYVAKAILAGLGSDDALRQFDIEDAERASADGSALGADAGPHIVEVLKEARALLETPPRSLQGAQALACIAVSIYHEARDQPELGQRGVAAVILRRAEVTSRWGDTICEVVRPIQFSYLGEDLSFPEIDEPEAWRQAVTIAAQTILGGPEPRLAEADHYHTTEVAPAWRDEMRIVARIADHVFLRDPHS